MNGIERTVTGSDGVDYEITHHPAPRNGYEISVEGQTVGSLYVAHAYPPMPQLEVFLPNGEGAKRVFTEEEAVEFIVSNRNKST